MGYDDDISMAESQPYCTPRDIIKNVLIIGMLVTGSVNTLAKVHLELDLELGDVDGVDGVGCRCDKALTHTLSYPSP